jgi:multiple sugar transport system substrate-binding protein
VTSDLFIQGDAAALISGHWITDILYQQNPDSIVRENLGVVQMPGSQISGGMNLVIWKHSIQVNDALRLVQFLTRPDIQTKFIPQAGYLPVRIEALNQPPFTTDPNYTTLKESLISGRHLNAAYMWGMVEDQLVTALHSIWQTLFNDPQVNLEELIASRLKPLGVRLDSKLSYQF